MNQKSNKIYAFIVNNNNVNIIINNDNDDDDDSGVLEHTFSSEPQAPNLIVKQKQPTSKHNLSNQSQFLPDRKSEQQR